MDRGRNQRVEVGEVWSTTRNPRLPSGEVLEEVKSMRNVVILLDDEDAYDQRYPDIRVAPVSTETQYACDEDLILSGVENPLGKEIMIELWNSQPMLKMNLDRCLGKLSDGTIEQLNRLNQKVWGQEVDLEGIITGLSAIDSGDPRLAFQEREIEETGYLRGPANCLLELWEQEAEESLFNSLANLIRQVLVPPPSADVILATTPENVPVAVLEESGESRIVHLEVAKKLTMNENGRISTVLKVPADENFEGRILCARLNETELAAGTVEKGIAVIRFDVPEDMLYKIHQTIEECQAAFPIELPIEQLELVLEL